jgi:AraC-like DNA-binding protein
MRIVREESNWRVLRTAGGGHASLERLALRCGYRVGEVCEALGCCERYLYEVFVRDMGMPPKLWMKGERMSVARRKLMSGAAPADVAAELGFQGLQHFRREFRGVFGVTPAQFQRPATAAPAEVTE